MTRTGAGRRSNRRCFQVNYHNGHNDEPPGPTPRELIAYTNGVSRCSRRRGSTPRRHALWRFDAATRRIESIGATLWKLCLIKDARCHRLSGWCCCWTVEVSCASKQQAIRPTPTTTHGTPASFHHCDQCAKCLRALLSLDTPHY